MAGVSLIDVDLGKAAPFAVLAGLAIGLWWLWQRQQAQTAQDAAQATASPLAQYQAAADMALMQSIGAQPSGVPASSGSTANPLLPTYTAPGNPAANYTMPAPASAAVTLGSTPYAGTNGI